MRGRKDAGNVGKGTWRGGLNN